MAFDAVAEMENDEELVEVRLHLEDIARSEIARHRHRLTSLSTEQRYAVELLLISTADLISRQVIDHVQHYPEPFRKECVSVWSGAVVA